MIDSRWLAVDDYLAAAFTTVDAAFESVLETNKAAGLPPHDVSPNQGNFLHVLALMLRAKRILEIGTLGGYSTIWLARALPRDGSLVSLEIDPEVATIARGNTERVGLAHLIDIRIGPALESLALLADEGVQPFDLTFIDADKSNNRDYYEWALRLSRPGGAIVIDNIVRDGEVVDASSEDPSVLGVRKLVERLADDDRVSAAALQTVGTKGYDGFILAVVRDPTVPGFAS